MDNMALYEKFNDSFDVEGLKDDISKAGSSEFRDVPKGDYEVGICKLELTESKNGIPMAKVWFNVLDGEYKGQKIFMNQMLSSGFGIHQMNEFLESLSTNFPISFENFIQYGELIEQVFVSVAGLAEYQLSYGKNNKGFGTFNIVKRFK